MNPKKGIDVSKHQGKIDWEKVRSDGITFAILRAGYGKFASQKDSLFETNDVACRRLKLPTGAYWYSYAVSESDAKAEAQACLQVLQGRSYDLAVWYDVEDAIQWKLDAKTVTAMAEIFCQTLQNAGYTVGIYSYKSFLENRLSEEIRRRYPVWVAHTGVTQTDYAMPYQLWQFSHTGRVQGISGDVDLNYLYETASLPTLEPVEVQKPNTDDVYVVQKGDTLTEIAGKLGTTVQALVQAKAIQDPDKIYVGQQLQWTKTGSTSSNTKVYVVQKGDTLTKIAGKLGTTVQALVQANAIQDPDKIYVGQQLQWTRTGSTPSNTKVYVVQKGDTLTEIAGKLGTTVQALVQSNQIADPDYIVPGQLLRYE